MSEATEVVAESFVKKSIEDALVRHCLAPMPVSDSSSRSVSTTGKLVDVPQGLSKEGELVTFPRYIAEKVVVPVTAQQNDPPATELFVRREIQSRLYELGRKSFEHTIKILYGRASHLVADDRLATVEFVQKSLTFVFSPPSAEQELKAFAAPYLRDGEHLTQFFSRTNVSAADLRTLTPEQIRNRIKVEEDRQAAVARENAERREKNAKHAQEIREATPAPMGPWSI